MTGGNEDRDEDLRAEGDRSNESIPDAQRKARELPTHPGVYLFKDERGQVIYIGKAKNLRSRASSYFSKSASDEFRTRDWVNEIHDVDHVVCDSEVDALLMESRLIKDIQPRHNREQKDDKSFPYLMITTHEDFPRVEVTREPPASGARLFGPFAGAAALRGAVQVLQRIFKFRTCSLDIQQNDPRWKWFRPCLLANIDQCTAPCNLRITKEEYRADIRRLRMFLEGKKSRLLQRMTREMKEAATRLDFERAARLRDEIRMLETLDERGDLESHAQPEVFPMDPKRGLEGLRRVLKLEQAPRVIEGLDIAHLSGGETVASLVQFIDGLPFKPGYRRFRIRDVQGIDDFRSIQEVVSRRYLKLAADASVYPDLILIDGGKGQLAFALSAFQVHQLPIPSVVSLAKREELVHVAGRDEPLRLSRHAYALRLLQYVRDEAHRFAQHYHHILRRRRTFE